MKPQVRNGPDLIAQHEAVFLQTAFSSRNFDGYDRAGCTLRVRQWADDRDRRGGVCGVSLNDDARTRSCPLASDGRVQRYMPDLPALHLGHLLQAIDQRVRKLRVNRRVYARMP